MLQANCRTDRLTKVSYKIRIPINKDDNNHKGDLLFKY